MAHHLPRSTAKMLGFLAVIVPTCLLLLLLLPQVRYILGYKVSGRQPHAAAAAHAAQQLIGRRAHAAWIPVAVMWQSFLYALLQLPPQPPTHCNVSNDNRLRSMFQ